MASTLELFVHLGPEGAVNAALNLDPDWVAEIRRALSVEHSVTNRRFGS